ncbi:MAG: LysR family transcriptional regulator [Alcanivorax sp.]|nr:LysR family transcriptional regulator [Alcanivorax sp.]
MRQSTTPDLNDLLYFARVAEAGSFTAAAEALGVPKSRLSRRVAALEERIGVRLLHRTTRRLSLTDVGERYLRHCQAMLLEAEQAEETAASLTGTPRGHLRVSIPVTLAVTPALFTDFLARYPDIQLEVVLTNRRVDLLAENVDVALRVRSLDEEEPALIVRRLRPARAYLVASPALLAGRQIDTPDALRQLPVLGAVEADRKVHLTLTRPDGETRRITLEARFAMEDFAVRREAALNGFGFTLLPEEYCAADLAAGDLVQLLPDWSLPGGTIQLAYPHRRGMLPAVRAWIDHLMAAYDGAAS